MENKHTNALINSSSPYLLQHAHNPVNWQPWSDETLAWAKRENKLILVSIGYAACHWCHVMEHESFEDEGVAKVMNDNFVCIKVDREERPDVDNYYMTAVQLMRQQGGWPLNVIALPDGRPIWGGTYFPKETWKKNIIGVSTFYKNEPVQTEKYASDLQNGIKQVSLVVEQEVTAIEKELLQKAVNQWTGNFDMEWGGRKGQPKFPMPVNLEFLLYYGYMNQDKRTLDYVELTLTKMAQGGIYDQVGGGFARYSVDDKWIVPHFEKMLYDNAQLLSIYSKGFQQFGNDEFKTVVYETARFIERELMNSSGAFYSSLDADSEGVEGKFHIWNSKDLKDILANEYDLFADYYSIDSQESVENGNYILWRGKTDEEFAKEKNISPDKLAEKVKLWKDKLFKIRSQRIHPGLDDKTIVSWNSITIQGLVDAYFAFHDDWFLSLATKNANFIIENVIQTNWGLYHVWKKGKASVNGFLEDYAFTIQAFTSLFEATGEKKWLDFAYELLKYTFSNFYNPEVGLFYYSEKSRSDIVTNHYQNQDNVIPAANSVMANNLFRIYLIFGESRYLEQAKKMLSSSVKMFADHPTGYSNWGSLLLKITHQYYEVVVCGDSEPDLIKNIRSGYNPNILYCFSTTKSNVPILNGRFKDGKNLIYVCQNGACKLPVESVSEALQLMEIPNDKN